jgi:hypothetical protein
MRRGKANKVPCRYDLGFLPESWKMLLVAGNQVVRTRGIGAFEEHIVIGIAGDFKAASRRHDMAVIPDELQQLLASTFADSQLRECAGGPLASGSLKPLRWYRWPGGAEALVLLLLRSGGLDNLIDLPGGEAAGSLPLRVFANNS